MIKLYHYSNKDFNGYISPSFFGENNFSNNSKRLSRIKRSYFYLDKNKKEVYFNNAKYLYITAINKIKLYNLNNDKKNIVKKLKNTQDIYQEIKKRGYSGLIGSNGLPCVVLFKPIKIIKKITLTKHRNYAIL